MNTPNKLSDLKVGEAATVCSLLPSSIEKRFADIGLIKGTAVKCLCQSPGRDMKAYLIRGAVIAIRNEDCRCVCITKEKSRENI